MRIPILVVVIVLASQAQADDSKKKPEGSTVGLGTTKAEVRFPDKPAKKEIKDGAQYLLETMGGKAVFLATANPWLGKTDITNKDFVKTVFENAVGGLEKSLKGKKLSDKESKFADKYPSRDVDLDVPGLGIYRTRWVMTPTAFIQIVVAGPKDFVDGAGGQKVHGVVEGQGLNREPGRYSNSGCFTSGGRRQSIGPDRWRSSCARQFPHCSSACQCSCFQSDARSPIHRKMPNLRPLRPLHRRTTISLV